MLSLCPKKDVCGSCSLSDIPYSDQLTSKLNQINAEFKNSGYEYYVTEIINSPKTSHYRNRMDFVVSYKGEIGLREKGKWWKVIDDHTCFISEEKIEEVFKLCRGWIKSSSFTFFDRKSFIGFLRYLVIRSTKEGQVLLNIVTSNPDANEEKVLSDFVTYLAAKVKNISIVWSVNSTNSDVSFGDKMQILQGTGTLTEKINGFRYHITPNAFFQTNAYAAELLQNKVLEFMGDVKGKSVLDLYCGSGFFSIPLAKEAGNITGIELVPEAIVDAKTNAQENNVHISFEARKAEDLSWQGLSASHVLVDPPRAGLHPKVLEALVAMAPDKIVYVSCNYKNFVKELSVFSTKYSIKKSVAVDMFPHTPHVELVTLLEKI